MGLHHLLKCASAAFDRGSGYSGSLTRYFAVLQDFGGALEIIPNSGGGATSYVVTTAALGASLFPTAQTYKVKIVVRVVEDGTTTVISGSTTPPSSNNTTTGIYFDGGNSDERHYEITGSGLIKSSDNVFTSGGQNLLSSGGTISGNLVVTGDLTVQGTTTTINVADLTVADKDITLNYSSGDSSSTANNAGIIIQDAVDASTDASILWKTASDSFEFSHNVVLGTAQLRAGSAILTQDNGNQALYIDTSSSWTSGVLNAPGLVWREANNDVIAGIRGYIDANGNNNLALGVGWLDTELIVTSVGVTLPNTLTTGVVTVKGGSADWNETTPGHGKGSIHLDPESNADNFGSAITWGASDSNNGETAQAGIYIRSDGNYGTAMYLSTTDSYSSGSKTAVLIDSAGNTRIQRGNFYVSTGSAVISGALNADSLILNDNNFATEKSYSGTGIFSQSGDWYTLFTINENNTPAYCTLKWEAHSTTTFVVTTGYQRVKRSIFKCVK